MNRQRHCWLAWLASCAAIDGQVQALATDFLTLAMATVGQTPAPGADRLVAGDELDVSPDRCDRRLTSACVGTKTCLTS